MADQLGDETIPDRVQRLDFLSTFPVDEANGMFPVGFNGSDYHGGDHVSCGQAMYNFAKAIEAARSNHRYDTSQWERFLKKACDGQVKRVMDPSWDPLSTAEGFYMAP